MVDGLVEQGGDGPELHMGAGLRRIGSLISSCCVGCVLGPGCQEVVGEDVTRGDGLLFHTI